MQRLYDLLRCPACDSPLSNNGKLSCASCGTTYPLFQDAFPLFLGGTDGTSPWEQVESRNLEKQAGEIYQPDWRVDYNIERIDLIERLLPDGLVLDVGAADGQIAAHLTTPTRTVFGVGKSPSWFALHGSLSVPCIYCDIYKIPLARGKFDGLLFGEILEHIYDPTEALRRTIPLLKPGGVLIGTVPNFYFFKKRLRYMLGGFGEDPDRPLTHEHIRQFSCRILRELLRGLDLDDIRIYGVWQRNVFPLLSMPDLFKPVQTALVRWYPSVFAVTLVFHAKRRAAA